MKKEVIAQGRGGCFDALITALTFGNFGVESRKVTIELRPNDFPLTDENKKKLKHIKKRRLIYHSLGSIYVGTGIEKKIIRTPAIKP